MKQIEFFRNKAMRKNKKGGIEGLPLQLMIIIVVASLGLALMVGWMNGIEAPKTIEDVDIDVSGGSRYNTTKTVTVTVYDQDGYALSGADVVITGLGATGSNYSNSVPYGTTGENGTVTINVSLPNLETYGYLNVEVSKSGYTGMTTTVLVTR